MASDPKISVLTAMEYWNSHSLSVYADHDDILTITRRINGGTNGLDTRKTYLDRAKKAISKDIFVVNPTPTPTPVPVPTPTPTPPTPPIPLNIVVAKRGDKSLYVKGLQDMLIRKGENIASDGDFGPMTEQAVKDFQSKNGLPVTGSIDTDTLNKLMV